MMLLLRRLGRLYIGLALFGLSIAMMVRAQLGLASWDVLHQGVAARTGVQFGLVVIGVAVVVLLLWVPLRQRPGFGTLSNVVLVGLAADAALGLLPAPAHLAARAALLGGGVLVNALATGLYIGAGLGPGPRDGLMTGLAARGRSIRVVRTAIEVGVLTVGWLLGGAVGVGTLIYAVSIGPLVHYLLPRLSIAPTGRPAAPHPKDSAHEHPAVRPQRLDVCG